MPQSLDFAFQNVLSLIQDALQHTTIHLVVSSGLLQFLPLSLFLMTVAVLRSTVRYFVECPPIWVFLMFSSWFEWDDEFGGGRPQRWSALLITSHQNYILSTQLVTDDVNLDHVAKVKFARFLHCQVFLLSMPPPCPILFGSKSLSRAHTQGMGS